jgi:hypothetical protein
MLADRQRLQVAKFILNQEVSMSTDTRADAMGRRIQALYAGDPQFAAARPPVWLCSTIVPRSTTSEKRGEAARDRLPKAGSPVIVEGSSKAKVGPDKDIPHMTPTASSMHHRPAATRTGLVQCVA